ncbi:MAG: hypothetical protein LH481_11760 [Burkholderiales bacterium]|nr:hypothetical protein [Burkholderiales bacterium]
MKSNVTAPPGQEEVVAIVNQPAGNASQPMEKPRARRKAQADQTTLLEKGPNALPVSDYPLKKGPIAGNGLDLKEQARLRTGKNKEK